MNKHTPRPLAHLRSIALAAAVAALGLPAWADPSFLAVAAGDATASSAIVWTRATDVLAGSTVAASGLTLQLSTDSAFSSIAKSVTGLSAADATHDFTMKVDVSGLSAATTYFYRFSGGGSTSATGRFTTTPASNTASAVRFAFSGDADGLMRPYPLVNNFQQQGGASPRDFFVFLGDTIYETVSKGSAAAAVPTSGANPSNLATVLRDYQTKYRENLQGVNSATGAVSGNGQQGLAPLYAAQGNYTLLDNHELGNKQYINGGAPVAALSLSGNGAKPTDLGGSVHNTGAAINATDGYKTFLQAYNDYQPVRVVTGADGLQQLYLQRDWGKNLSLTSVDDRSYRDVRLKDAAGLDDTPASYLAGASNAGKAPSNRWADASRTMLGSGQLSWLEQSLLNQQAAGQVWKVVAVSSPIDQAGNDGGKSWIGGYQAERNALLKFIDDQHIDNVVFLSTDDHYSRANQLWYTDNGVVKRSSAFTIVTGPIGATGPVDNDHTFATEQSKLAGVNGQLAKENAAMYGGLAGDAIGLKDFGGRITHVKRDHQGTLTDGTADEAINFFSIDTNAYTNFDIDADGTMHVTVWGIDAYASNAFPQSSAQPRVIFSFDVSAVPEPSQWLLSLMGLAALAGWQRRRAATQA
jgi:MYXO-CTERM domain-containing protein